MHAIKMMMFEATDLVLYIIGLLPTGLVLEGLSVLLVGSGLLVLWKRMHVPASFFHGATSPSFDYDSDQDEATCPPRPLFINLFSEGASSQPLTTTKLQRVATYKVNNTYITIGVGNVADFYDPYGPIVIGCNESCMPVDDSDQFVFEAGGSTLKRTLQDNPQAST